MILMILLLANIWGLSFSSPHLYGKYHQEGHPPGVTEPGDDCRKFTRFHESVLKAGASFDQTCVETSPIYECTTPTANVLKKCVRGLNVNAWCVDQMYQVCEM